MQPKEGFQASGLPKQGQLSEAGAGVGEDKEPGRLQHGGLVGAALGRKVRVEARICPQVSG